MKKPELPRSADKTLAYATLLNDTSLTPTAKAVGYQLVDHFNRKTGRCDPGIAMLIRNTGRCRRSIFKALRQLESAGFVTRARHGGGGQTNAYAIHWGRLREPALSPKPTGASARTTPRAKLSPLPGALTCTQTFEGTIEDKPLGGGLGKNHMSRRSEQSKTRLAIKENRRGKLPRSSQVMVRKAGERWERDLTRILGDRYPEAICLMTEEIADAATMWEIEHPGEGHRVVLAGLKELGFD